MRMGKKVAELNTLSDGKGITGIRFFNQMEDTNESTNLRKLADVWMSKNRCCQGHRNRSAVSVTRITVDIGHPSREEEEVNQHRFRSQICRKTSVFTKLHGHKTIEVEFRIRVERPLLPRCRYNTSKLERMSSKTRRKRKNSAGYSTLKITRMRRNDLWSLSDPASNAASSLCV